MVNYNPDAGLIVGQEWVPLRNEPFTLSADREIGWNFTTSAPVVASTGRIYVEQSAVDPFGTFAKPVDTLYTMMSVYPRGFEDKTGPMRSSIVEISGGSIAGNAGATLIGAGSVRDALYYPGTNRGVSFSSSTQGIYDISLQFNFSGHPELAGKRITRLEFLYVIQVGPEFVSLTNQGGIIELDYANFSTGNNNGGVFADTGAVLSQSGLNFESPAIDLPIIDYLYQSIAQRAIDIASGPPFPCYPWTYQRLLKLDNSADPEATSLYLRIIIPNLSTLPIVTYYLNYAALRVTYCEEERLAYGGHCFGIQRNSDVVNLRSPSLIANSALLPAGNYTLTVEGGKLNTELYAVKELYSLPGQEGVVVNHSTSIGSTFETVGTHQIVMMSIHDPTTAIISGNAYGIQEQADVFGYSSTTLADQIIMNTSLDGTLNYPNVRFFARRFGDTSDDLSLTSAANPAVTVSISVEDFDALDEITDGWKQVDLVFPGTEPSFDNSGTGSRYYWSSLTDSGSPWQVMVGSSAAFTNAIPSTLITGISAVSNNNYFGQTAYASVDAVAQLDMDATLLFAQEMPAVSGLTLIPSTLSLTGIDLECGVPLDCVPTGLAYNELTWQPLGSASVPATGFGYYELQRNDNHDNTWQTLLLASSPLVTGFSDFEARVGIQSNYRIRFLHRLLFASPWSPLVSATIASPGISGVGNSDGNGVLIFTSNERQTGSASLAHMMVSTGSVSENVEFLEASEVTYQKMYNRDYQVAFHPLERGGEKFTRTLLVQAAAVADGLMQYGFTSLRDLAWEDLSYVCVRDELGDRWLSSVVVPTGTVQRNRQLYLAQVAITEVTATSSIVTLPSATQGSGSSSSGCITADWDGIPGWDYGCWA